MIIAPAMNTHMWDHPFTARHLAVLSEPPLAYRIVEPACKLLACGDMGASKPLFECLRDAKLSDTSLPPKPLFSSCKSPSVALPAVCVCREGRSCPRVGASDSCEDSDCASAIRK